MNLWRSLLLLLMLTACHRRTAHEAAAAISGLQIPPQARVLEFTDQTPGFMEQDLWVTVELELTTSELANVVAQARARKYWSIRRPWTDDSIHVDFVDGQPNAPFGYGAAVRHLVPGQWGLFQALGSYSNETTVTIDLARKRLFVAAFIL